MVDWVATLGATARALFEMMGWEDWALYTADPAPLQERVCTASWMGSVATLVPWFGRVGLGAWP